MIKRNNKKGFTIVELVIVIAVIAILAAVLIPTFAGIIKKANISADTQLCKNMNTALSMAKAEGKSVDTMEDVLFAINEAGYVIENLNPTTEGYYFAWDEANDQILFLNNEFAVHYPEDATLNAAKCWITVGDAAEAATVAAQGFALYLEPGFNEALTLANLVSVDTGANANVALKIESANEGTIAIRGSYATVELAAENAHVDQYGVVETATGKVAANSFVVNGFVKSLALTEGKVVVAATGVVETVEDSAKALVNTTESKGIIVNGAPDNYTSSAAVTINNKAELEAFRDIVNGGYDYDDITVTLNADIDLAGVAWLPIGNFYRDTVVDGKEVDNTFYGFKGTFDGNGHTIKNLSNEGFSVVGLTFGSNKTTPAGCTEAVYGLFGTVIDAEIKNLTVTADIDMVTDATKLGDSVGAIVGFASGASFKIENCKVSGSVKGYDGVGGLVGRCYATTTTATNCTNDANVYGIRKTAGIIGYTSAKGGNLVASGYAGNGTVTAGGRDADTNKLEESNANYSSAKFFVVCNGMSYNGEATGSTFLKVND